MRRRGASLDYHKAQVAQHNYDVACGGSSADEDRDDLPTLTVDHADPILGILLDTFVDGFRVLGGSPCEFLVFACGSVVRLDCTRHKALPAGFGLLNPSTIHKELEDLKRAPLETAEPMLDAVLVRQQASEYLQHISWNYDDRIFAPVLKGLGCMTSCGAPAGSAVMREWTQNMVTVAYPRTGSCIKTMVLNRDSKRSVATLGDVGCEGRALDAKTLQPAAIVHKDLSYTILCDPYTGEWLPPN